MTDTKKLKDFLRVESTKQKIIELETMLTACKAMAPENGGDGENTKAVALEHWLRTEGFENIQRYDAPDNRVSSKTRPNLVVTIPGKNDDYSIWVVAHMDVVPAGEISLWDTDPWTVVEKDGKLFGRGVEDNQQGLCSAVFAALSYLKNNERPEHTVKLLFAADEEVGSTYGMVWLTNNTDLFKKGDMVIIPDGGDSLGQTIEVAEKNLLWAEVQINGKQCHGSRPDQGNNACLAANDLSMRLYGLKNIFNKRDEIFEPPYSTFEPTKRLANVSGINIIPGEETFCFDCRILPCYTLEEVQKQFEALCSQVAKEYDVAVDVKYPQAVQSPATDTNASIVKKLSLAIMKAHGLKARTIGIGGGTVAADLRKKGIDAVVWSTLDEMAHMPNEYCIIENLLKDAETIVEFFAIED